MHCRRPAGTPALPDPSRRPGTDAGEQVLLDENALAAGHDYFALGGFAVSPDHALLAYRTDVTGGERYTLRFRDLATGADLADVVDDVYYGLAWADDDAHDLLRPARRRDAPVPGLAPRARHADRRRRARVPGGRRALLRSASAARAAAASSLIDSGVEAHDARCWFVDADAPDGAAARRRAARARASSTTSSTTSTRRARRPASSSLTNADGAENFKLMVAPVATPGPRALDRASSPHRADVRLDDVDAFADHLVLSERADGLEQLRVLGLADADARPRARDARGGVQRVGRRRTPSSTRPTLRYGYTSLVAPPPASTTTSTTRTRDAREAPAGARLRPERVRDRTRLWATAPDGTRVPISIVHRRDLRIDGTAPAAALRLRLVRDLDRPDVLGRRGCQPARPRLRVRDRARARRRRARPAAGTSDGKLEHKRNTFTDFIACAEHLVAEGYTSPDRLVARGGSAGGLLMGAVANLRPDLFRGDRRRGAVRRLPHHDARRDAPAHGHRVGGVGRPGRTTPRSTTT